MVGKLLLACSLQCCFYSSTVGARPYTVMRGGVQFLFSINLSASTSRQEGAFECFMILCRVVLPCCSGLQEFSCVHRCLSQAGITVHADAIFPALQGFKRYVLRHVRVRGRRPRVSATERRRNIEHHPRAAAIACCRHRTRTTCSERSTDT